MKAHRLMLVEQPDVTQIYATVQLTTYVLLASDGR